MYILYYNGWFHHLTTARGFLLSDLIPVLCVNQQYDFTDFTTLPQCRSLSLGFSSRRRSSCSAASLCRRKKGIHDRQSENKDVNKVKA